MKTRFIIIGVICVVSLVVLAFATGGGGKDSVVVVDTSVLAARPDRYTEQDLRMRGFVKTGSVLLYGTRADFVVYQDGKEFPVHFTGKTQLPDTFQDEAPVRVDGRLNTAGDKLIATRVEAKCASKYDATYAGDNGHPASIPLHTQTATP